LCRVLVFILFVLCTQCCQFSWIVHFWLPFRYSPTFIFISRYWGDRLHKLIAFVFSLFLILD
jgi:hypothetical protein